MRSNRIEIEVELHRKLDAVSDVNYLVHQEDFHISLRRIFFVINMEGFRKTPGGDDD